MPEGPPSPGPDDEEWAKTQAEADIAQFKNLVEDATVEEVDEPSGRKEVEIAWEDENGFHVEEGEAYGVYREYSDAVGLNGGDSGEPTTAIESYHIDWTDGRGRTTVAQEDVVDLEEGDWYTS